MQFIIITEAGTTTGDSEIIIITIIMAVAEWVNAA